MMKERQEMHQLTQLLFLVSLNFVGQNSLLHHIIFFHEESATLSYVLWIHQQS